jgi:uncharacterized repeat protein (TIGR03809 family)
LWVAFVSEIEQPHSRDEMARRWQSLAERRRQHLLELYRSGRWRRYYSEDQLMAQMRDAVRGVEQWGHLAGPARSDEIPHAAE